MFWIALTIFSASLVLFIFDWVDKTIVSIFGAVLLIVLGVLEWHEAIAAIDFETIALLFGLMVLVAVAQHSGIFSWLNVRIAEKSGGNPLILFFLFTALTFFTSTFLNNVTVILLVIPIAVALAKGLGLNTKLFVITLALFSNIGGTLTLIGDPPNTLIGVQAGLTFNDFVRNLSVPIFAMSFVIIAGLALTHWKDLKPISTHLPKVFISSLIISRIKYQFSSKRLDPYLVGVTILFTLFAIVAFIIQPQLDISVGALGLFVGIFLALLVSRKIPFTSVIREIEWDSLLFFIGLFIQVGALQKVGVLELITETIVGFSDNYAVLLLIIIWGIGIASSVINNIPFVALMIPVIMDLQHQLQGQSDLDLLWWALALGACLGGNGTVFGSSAGLIAVDLAKKSGVKISSWEFMKLGIPVTFISLVISSFYILGRLYL